MANKKTVEWDRNPLSRNIKDLEDQANRFIDQVMEFESVNAQNDMRLTAPWTDRTGNARQGLFAQAYVQGDEHGMVLYHTVNYGIFLETANSSKYEVIMPTVNRTGHAVMSDLSSLLRKRHE